jgi:hypothetical protein
VNDIVEQLRHVFDWEDGSHAVLCGEAADEIERLRQIVRDALDGDPRRIADVLGQP